MTRRPAKPATGRLRCAIYTRKSSEEGLDQDFNSLDAQREACEAYVMSQAGEGWTALPARYDDGGFSGGNMERPGLKKLLADIGRGAVDIVVVYKVDRLTRSLADFARIVDTFDGKGVSFVSVTQAFNTTTSMGRLTLNVLLSFAQFEREVTGERIRDKIAASKAKGMWMGGTPPLGYRPSGRTLSIDKSEARTVRHIFERYLTLRSVHVLRDELAAQGIRSRPGKRSGLDGAPFTRGALYHLLVNRLYVGEIVHKDRCYPGQHPAIIDRVLFDEVATLLATNRSERMAKAVTVSRAPLTGLIFDADGRPMCPVSTRNRHGRVYRYYVSSVLQQGSRQTADAAAMRIPAPAIEKLVLDRIPTGSSDMAGWDEARQRITRVEVGDEGVSLILRYTGRYRADRYPEGDAVHDLGEGLVEVKAPIPARAWNGRCTVERAPARRADGKVDASLARALARAHAMVRRATMSPFPTLEELATDHADDGYVRRLARLAFLAPDIQQAIVEGKQPADMRLERLMRGLMPLQWSEQRQAFGFANFI